MYRVMSGFLDDAPQGFPTTEDIMEDSTLSYLKVAVADKVIGTQ
jgi:hypothetical protein